MIMVAFAIDKEIFVFGDVVIPATPTHIETARMFSHMFSRESCVFSRESQVFSRESCVFSRESRVFSRKTRMFSRKTRMFSGETCVFSREFMRVKDARIYASKDVSRYGRVPR